MATAAQSVGTFTRKRKVICANPNRDKPVVKTSFDISTDKGSAAGETVIRLRRWLSCVKVDVTL